MKRFYKNAIAVLAALAVFANAGSAFALTKTYPVTLDDPDVEFVTMTVIYEDEEAGITSFDDLTDANFASVIHSVEMLEIAPGQTDAQLQVVIDSDDRSGVYLTKLTYMSQDPGKTRSEFGQIYNFTEEEVAQILADFHGSSTPLTDMEDLVNIGYVSNALYQQALETEDFETLFETVKSERYPEVYASADVLESHIRDTLFLSAMMTLEAEELTQYIAAQDLATIFPENEVDTEMMKDDAFAPIFVSGRDESMNSMKTLAQTINASIAVILLQDGTPQEKAEALEKYADVLGLDLELADENDVSLIRIARVIEGADIAEIQQSYLDAVESFKKTVPVIRPSGSSGGGGGGGGSYSSGNDYVSGNLAEKTPVTLPEVSEPAQTPAQTPVQNQADVVFSDVPADHWGAEAVYALVEKNIVSDQLSVFRADDSISRAEFLKILVLTLGIEMKGSDVNFSDAPKTQWYYPYVCAGYNAGVVKGISDGWFGAEDAITREDAVVMIQRAKNLQTIREFDANYTDAAQISDYAQSAVELMSGLGIIKGFEDNTFRPQSNLTRAEAAVLIYNASQH